MGSLEYTSIPKKGTVKEAEIPELLVAPLLQPPCSYFMHPITMHGGKAGSSLEKGIGCGKRNQMLMLGLTPKSFLQGENHQNLHHWMLEMWWRAADPSWTCLWGRGWENAHPVSQACSLCQKQNCRALSGAQSGAQSSFSHGNMGLALAKPALRRKAWAVSPWKLLMFHVLC